MKVWIEPDEFWPWFNVMRQPDTFADGMDVDDETAERWVTTLGAAMAVQNEIRRAIGWDE